MTDPTTDPSAAADPDPLVCFDGTDKVYGSGFRALAPIDLRLPRAEITVLVGPSGCGKTTLLRMAAGLTRPTHGRLTRRTERMSYVFQDPTLLAWRQVRANVELVAKLQKVPKAQRRARADNAIELVGLRGFEKAYPRELSGGMRMRVSLARSLTSEPELLLMDEPFAALDAQTRETLQDELLRIWRSTGKTILFITHGIDEAVYLGQRVAVLTSRPGRVKAIVEVDLDRRNDQDQDADTDIRSSERFREIRHHIWTLLHTEVTRAEQLAGAAASPQGTDRRPAHV